MKTKLIIFCLCCALVSGCAYLQWLKDVVNTLPIVTPTPTSTVTPYPDMTPTPTTPSYPNVTPTVTPYPVVIPAPTVTPVPGMTPTPTTPSLACQGVFLADHCWYLGAQGQACTAVCAVHGGCVSLVLSASDCTNVLRATNAIPDSFTEPAYLDETPTAKTGCIVAALDLAQTLFGWYTAQQDSCDVAVATYWRVCSCQE